MQSVKNLLLNSSEEAFYIRLHLGQSLVNIALRTMRRFPLFCFNGWKNRKPKLIKVGCCKMKKHYGLLLAKWGIFIAKKQPEAGKVIFVCKCQPHRIRNFQICQLLCFFRNRVNFNVNRVSVPGNIGLCVVEIRLTLSVDDFKMTVMQVLMSSDNSILFI